MSLRQETFCVLFVCTGNVCRSATAELLLRRRIQEAAESERFVVASAGVGTQDGWRIDPTIADLLGRRDVAGAADFRSRVLTADALAQADLVLTGTRDHRLRIGKCWPESYPRTFTLRECASLLRAMPADVQAGLPSESRERADAVVGWLQEERGLVAISQDELDIADPVGRRTGVYRRTVEEVASAVDTLADVLFPGAWYHNQ